jgi:hypothetical protein
MTTETVLTDDRTFAEIQAALAAQLPDWHLFFAHSERYGDAPGIKVSANFKKNGRRLSVYTPWERGETSELVIARVKEEFLFRQEEIPS